MATVLVRSHKIYFLLIAFLIIHAGAIRKNYDAIVDTQTDAVSWKQLEEQMKDGEKAAPTPSFKFYGNANFQFKSPVDNQTAATVIADDAAPGSSVPEEVKGTEAGGSEENWWMESWQDPGTKGHGTTSEESAEVETPTVEQSSYPVEEKTEKPSEFWEENW